MPGRYQLTGPQVEPEAAHWTFEGYRIRVVDIHTDHPTGGVVPPFNDSDAYLESEIAELEFLANNRNNAGAISGIFPDNNGPPRVRRPLSRYFSLRPPPITAQFNTFNWTVPDADPDLEELDATRTRPIRDVLMPCEPGEPLVRTGQELARMFQDETPGLLHRHALNCLLFERPGASPPRQARIWMALDVTIYSALLAAWHIKWGHREGGAPDYSRSYVERPIEYEERRPGPNRFTVLYDYRLNPDGREGGARRCPDEVFSPGTPRHPAYPSGHSTYSAAASRILEYFFAPEGSLPPCDQWMTEEGSNPVAVELRRLADNIGMARLWAGVHWRQDHTTGQRLGCWVADQVIAQLCQDPVLPLPDQQPNPCDSTIQPPTFEMVEEFKDYRRDQDGQCEPNHDRIPEPDPAASIQDFQSQRGAF